MAAFFPDKRTRSQLTLPDNLFHQLPLDRSPLKDARTRLQSEPPTTTMADSAESDDELLLSPSPSKKRAASPWTVNEYVSNSAIRSDFPAAKRLRREGGDIEGDYENVLATPTTSTSEGRLATEASSKGTSSTTSSPDKQRRAQSVPAFPMIDLRNPPSSANKRQRSRSPSRPLPEFVHKPIPLPTIQEPSNSSHPQQPSNTLTRVENTNDDDTLQTPARMPSFNDLGMSPLTPLPETPAQAADASVDDSAMDVDSTPRPAPSTSTTMAPSASLPSLPKFNPASRIPSSSKASISKPAPASKNAFTFMMAKAKGAAKEPPAPKVTTATTTGRKGKEKAAPSKAPAKSSLKSNMKAKTKAAPKLFVPPVQDDEDDSPFSESKPSTSNERARVEDEPAQPPAVERTVAPVVTTETIAQAEDSTSNATDDLMNPDAPLFTEDEDEDEDLPKKDKKVVDETPAPEQSLPVDSSLPNGDVLMDIASDAVVPETVNAATPSQSVPPSESSNAIPPSLPVQGKPVSDSKKSLKAGASKKKQMTSGIPRVTRGSLKKKEEQAEKASQAPRSTAARKKALISAAQASPKKTVSRKELSPLSDLEESGDAPVASTSTIRVPQTPAKVPSFAKPTQSSLAKTPAAPRSPVKTSPSKMARSTTLPARPAKTYAFQTEPGSLLNQYYSKIDELNSSISQTPGLPHPPGVPRSAPALKRSVTHESALFSKAGPSSARSNGPSSTSQAGQQRSIADFIDVKSNDANPVAKRMMTGRGKPIFPNKATYKASQKTPLAAVPGSPVKGGTSVLDLSGDVSFESESGESNTARLTLLAARTQDDELKGILDNTLNKKGKRKASPEEEQEDEESRRVSTAEAFMNLRQAMGPPATPPRRGLRSASSTIPSSASVPNLEPYARPHSALATVRSAEDDAEAFPSDDEDVDEGDLIDDKNYHGGSKKQKGRLTILSHVRAFVDVRDAHTSRDSGEAFVEFLEELGAKVFKKLTKTCTHIVFKNGSFSTVSKWKAAETKPLVVRISWVTECVNRKEHVAEDEHIIDISGLFPSGVDPKTKVAKSRSSRSGHPSSDGADESFDISMDSSTQPLEVARHRRRESRESGHR